MTKLELNDTIGAKLFRKAHAKGIRQKSLQKLLLLKYILIERKEWGGMYEELMTREKYTKTRYDLACSLKIEEIMGILRCSRRTAIDYKETLKDMLFG